MPSKFQDMLKVQRQNPDTARAGIKWDDSDDNILLQKLEEDVALDEIARILRRTEGSVKTRLIIYGLNKMENDKMSLDEVSQLIKVSVKDIEAHQLKTIQRDERKHKVNKRPVSLEDIYNIVNRLEKKFEEFLSK